ncbi:MAG TPA: hypothetical protein VFM96_02825, partial [Gaiellaceae bacterium]|nr:hypothetical protein [Gaiellaceae bacterium]
MANVREGITIEGEPANALEDFDVALAAQVGKTRAVVTPSIDAAREVAASGDEIRERIAAPTLTTRVADGLEVHDPIAEREAREAADAERSSEHKTVVLAKILGEQAQRAETAEAELAVRAFHDRLYEAEERADVVSALAELRAVAPQAYETALSQMTDLESLFDLEDAYIFADVETDEEADAVARTKLNGEVAWKLESDYAEAKTFVD